MIKKRWRQQPFQTFSFHHPHFFFKFSYKKLCFLLKRKRKMCNFSNPSWFIQLIHFLRLFFCSVSDHRRLLSDEYVYIFLFQLDCMNILYFCVLLYLKFLSSWNTTLVSKKIQVNLTWQDHCWPVLNEEDKSCCTDNDK